MTIEFNLLYRWHPMVPDRIGEGESALSATDFVQNNRLVLDRGIEQLITQFRPIAPGRSACTTRPRS